MNITTKYMTENDCYKAGRKIKPEGIMVHSTATPGVMAADWFSRWNRPGTDACVHAFLDDKDVYQYLPWVHRGWHAGGAANNTHISFEICEPGGFRYAQGATMVGYNVSANEEYFNKAYNNAVELCVMLCRQYGLTEKDIICHSEGYQKGIASNHADVMHWFPKHGKSMDIFREDVRRAINGQVIPSTPTQIPGVKTWHLYVQGEIVKELQAALNRLGFRDNQGRLLDIDGYLGDLTLQAMEKVLIVKGYKNELVKVIQERLKQLAYDLPKYGVDGILGNETEAAVRLFQRDRGLVVDAKVGINTLKALFKK